MQRLKSPTETDITQVNNYISQRSAGNRQENLRMMCMWEVTEKELRPREHYIANYAWRGQSRKENVLITCLYGSWCNRDHL